MRWSSKIDATEGDLTLAFITRKSKGQDVTIKREVPLKCPFVLLENNARTGNSKGKYYDAKCKC